MTTRYFLVIVTIIIYIVCPFDGSFRSFPRLPLIMCATLGCGNVLVVVFTVRVDI